MKLHQTGNVAGRTILAGVGALLLVAAALAAIGLTGSRASADTVTLVPAQDLATEPGWEADDGTPCGNGGGTVCSSRID